LPSYEKCVFGNSEVVSANQEECYFFFNIIRQVFIDHIGRLQVQQHSK